MKPKVTNLRGTSTWHVRHEDGTIICASWREAIAVAWLIIREAEPSPLTQWPRIETARSYNRRLMREVDGVVVY
jgi:hypothetical protein